MPIIPKAEKSSRLDITILQIVVGGDLWIANHGSFDCVMCKKACALYGNQTKRIMGNRSVLLTLQSFIANN